MNNKLIEIKKLTLKKDKISNNLIKNTNDDKLVLLEDTDFIVNKGEVVIILGRNGTGKTTLIETLIGKSEFDAISKEGIYIDPLICTDRNLINENIIAYARNEMLEGFDNMKNKNIIKNFYIKEYDNSDLYKDKINDNLERLKELFKFKGNERKRKYIKSSSGERKKTALIGALSRYNAPLYIFDEPVNCLDVETMSAFRDEVSALKKQGASVIIITHCRIFKDVDRVYRIMNKKLVDITEEYKSKSYDCIDL